MLLSLLRLLLVLVLPSFSGGSSLAGAVGASIVDATGSIVGDAIVSAA